MPDETLPQDKSNKQAHEWNLPDMLERLDQQLNDSELRELCFKLGVDYENLPPGSKKDKARELISALERRERLHELMAMMPSLKPGMPYVPEGLKPYLKMVVTRHAAVYPSAPLDPKGRKRQCSHISLCHQVFVNLQADLSYHTFAGCSVNQVA